MKICPFCDADSVITLDADNDMCTACKKWFPTLEDQKTVYCHECSKAGGAECAIYHLPPRCETTKRLLEGKKEDKS